MGDVVYLRRPGAPLAPPPPPRKHSAFHAMQAGPGSVSVFIGSVELWLSPEQADDFGDELKRFAKAARELSNPKAE